MTGAKEHASTEKKLKGVTTERAERAKCDGAIQKKLRIHVHEIA